MTFGFHREQWSELPPSPSILVGILYYHPVYIRTVHPRIYIHTLAQRCVRCVDTQSGTSCPTNWDLSLLLVVMEAMPQLRTLVRDEKVCEPPVRTIYVYIYMFSREISSPFTFSCLFFPFFLSYFSARQIKGTHVATVLRVSLAFCSGSPREWPRDRKSRCVVDVLLSSKNFLFNFFSQVNFAIILLQSWISDKMNKRVKFQNYLNFIQILNCFQIV